MRLHLSAGTYFTCLLMFILLAFVFLFGSGNSNNSISELIVNHGIIANIFYFVLAFLPLAWLFTSEIWKEAFSIPQKILLVGLAVFISSMFYSVRYGINTGGFFFVSSFIFALSQRRLYKPSKVFYWFWIYLAIHIVSLNWTNDLAGGLNKIRVYLPFFSVPFFFCFFRLTNKEIDQLLLLFFRSATIFIFLSLLCWIYESSRIGIPFSDWFIFHKKEFNNQPPFYFPFSWVGYNHPSYISIGYNLALAVGIYLFDKRKGSCNINTFELLFFMFSALALTVIVQSRIGLVNFTLLVICGIGWLLRKERVYLYLYITTCLLLIALVAVNINIVLKYINDPIREQQYHTAIAYIKSNFLFGTGIGGMTKIMTSQEFALKLGYPFAQVENIYPSNQFLGDLMQTGILGFLTLIGMISSLTFNCIKQRNWVSFSLIISFLLLMSIEMPFFLLKGSTLFVLMSCLVLQMQRSKT